MTSGVFTLLVTLAILYQSRTAAADEHYTNEWAALISGGEENARQVAKRHGYEILASIPALEDHYVLKRHDVPHRSKRSAHHHTRRLAGDSNVHWVEQQIAKSRQKRFDAYTVRRDGSSNFNDPLFRDEWYIEGSTPGRERRGNDHRVDMQIPKAWAKGLTGKGVVLSVLDDGIEWNNTDLAQNYEQCASYDLNGNDRDPFPRYDPTNENKHGTRCAGEIAMAANNGVCGVGIAFNSRIGGVRMLDGKVTDSLEARALTTNLSCVHIFSASWGPNDDGVTTEGPGKLASAALEKGIKEGRGGKGVIYSWASGNGGRLQDNCNCDGYTSSPYTLSVSSASEHGKMPWYGEQCASTLATTYSSGNGGDHQVVSTDLHDKCTTHHTGTSAAAPMAAGIFALLLEANPDLTWRDVQHLVAMTSKMMPLRDNDGWYRNAAGFCVNLAFGFGLLDAAHLVTAGHPDTWQMVPERKTCTVLADERSNLPQNLTSGNFVEVKIHTDGCKGTDNEIKALEHIQLVITMSYSKRGALKVSLTSPSGTETVLMGSRDFDKSNAGFKEWPLMSVHTWGENPEGEWTLRVKDESNGQEHGQLEDVKLVLHGTSEVPAYQQGNDTVSCDIQKPSASGAASVDEHLSQREQSLKELLSLVATRQDQALDHLDLGLQPEW